MNNFKIHLDFKMLLKMLHLDLKMLLKMLPKTNMNNSKIHLDFKMILKLLPSPRLQKIRLEQSKRSSEVLAKYRLKEMD